MQQHIDFTTITIVMQATEKAGGLVISEPSKREEGTVVCKSTLWICLDQNENYGH